MALNGGKTPERGKVVPPLETLLFDLSGCQAAESGEESSYGDAKGTDAKGTVPSVPNISALIERGIDWLFAPDLKFS
jgi:hypothetical protein